MCMIFTRLISFDDDVCWFQTFMNPMFAELEARVKESENILDKMNE